MRPSRMEETSEAAVRGVAGHCKITHFHRIEKRGREMQPT